MQQCSLIYFENAESYQREELLNEVLVYLIKAWLQRSTPCDENWISTLGRKDTVVDCSGLRYKEECLISDIFSKGYILRHRTEGKYRKIVEQRINTEKPGIHKVYDQNYFQDSSNEGISHSFFAEVSTMSKRLVDVNIFDYGIEIVPRGARTL